MATSEDYIEFVCGQLAGAGAVRRRKMFGEYMVYVNGKPLLLVCDNTVFVKMLPALSAVLGFAVAAGSVALAVRRRLGALVEPRIALGSVLLSLLVGAIGWLLPAGGLLLLVELAGLFGLYLGLAWAAGLVGTADLAMLRGRRPA